MKAEREERDRKEDKTQKTVQFANWKQKRFYDEKTQEKSKMQEIEAKQLRLEQQKFQLDLKQKET